jgi:hypothetical protein
MARQVHRFEATLGADAPHTLFFEVPFDVTAAFGKARAPVRVELGGYVYRSTVSVYGGRYYVPVRREHRDGAGVAVGDRIAIKLALDSAPRVVEAPPALLAALARNARARAAWAALSYSHQREHAEAIRTAKKPETRARRVAAAIAMLLAKPKARKTAR